jgi:hypothetical protein
MIWFISESIHPIPFDLVSFDLLFFFKNSTFNVEKQNHFSTSKSSKLQLVLINFNELILFWFHLIRKISYDTIWFDFLFLFSSLGILLLTLKKKYPMRQKKKKIFPSSSTNNNVEISKSSVFIRWAQQPRHRLEIKTMKKMYHRQE